MKLNQYEWDPVKDLIAEGAFAEVFKARDTYSSRIVALKIYKEAVIKGTTGNSAHKKYSLEKEFTQIDGLSHTNLITFYGLSYIIHSDAMGRSSSHPVIIMEYASEGTLKDFLKTKPDFSTIEKVFKEIILGVGYLHREGIIHRDLKLDNVLISKNRQGKPVAKITDFGISKNIITEETIEQSFTSGVGTPNYMAPEQFFKKKYGLNGEISERTDIWAIGVIMYRSLKGKMPFGDGLNDYELIREAIISQNPDFIGVNNKYIELISQCLEKEANKRIDSAQKLFDQVNNLGGKHLIESESIKSPTINDVNEDLEKTVIAKVESPKEKSAESDKSSKILKRALMIFSGLLVTLSLVLFFIKQPSEINNVEFITDKKITVFNSSNYSHGSHFLSNVLDYSLIGLDDKPTYLYKEEDGEKLEVKGDTTKLLINGRVQSLIIGESTNVYNLPLAWEAKEIDYIGIKSKPSEQVLNRLKEIIKQNSSVFIETRKDVFVDELIKSTNPEFFMPNDNIDLYNLNDVKTLYSDMETFNKINKKIPLLEQLNVVGYDFSEIPTYIKTKSLSLLISDSISFIPKNLFSNRTELERLDIVDINGNVKNLDFIQSVKNLKSFSYVGEHKDFYLGDLKNLESCAFSNLSQSEFEVIVNNNKNLAYLGLIGQTEITNLNPLKKLKNLEVLEISTDVKDNLDLSVVRDLSNLRYIGVENFDLEDNLELKKRLQQYCSNCKIYGIDYGACLGSGYLISFLIAFFTLLFYKRWKYINA